MVIDPRLVEMLRGEVSRSVAAAIAPLEKKLDAQDEWMNGLYLVLEDLLHALAQERSPLLERLLPQLQEAAEQYPLACQGLLPDDSPHSLEPRKLLYRSLQHAGALRQLAP